MEPWVWAIVGVVPVVAVGAAYAMGAFSTDIPGINQKITQAEMAKTAFTGDEDESYQSAGRRHKRTKKSKSKHKKTKRHSK